MSKSWFITGATSGFGRAWAAAALDRGDRVAATALDSTTLEDLASQFGASFLPIEADVRDRDRSIEVLQQAHRHFGRLDVVVNNAGYGHLGCVEELTEAEARAQFETNFFGALWTTQAAIPLLREQGGGHILQVSSVTGLVGFPSLAIYHASKWALEGLTEALATEVAMFGIRTTLIEPGGYATDWTASASSSEPLPMYAPMRERISGAGADPASQPTAQDSVAAVMAAVDSDDPPSRLLLGSEAYGIVMAAYDRRLQVWRDWESASRSADAG